MPEQDHDTASSGLARAFAASLSVVVVMSVGILWFGRGILVERELDAMQGRLELHAGLYEADPEAARVLQSVASEQGDEVAFPNPAGIPRPTVGPDGTPSHDDGDESVPLTEGGPASITEAIEATGERRGSVSVMGHDYWFVVSDVRDGLGILTHEATDPGGWDSLVMATGAIAVAVAIASAACGGLLVVRSNRRRVERPSTGGAEDAL